MSEIKTVYNCYNDVGLVFNCKESSMQTERPTLLCQTSALTSGTYLILSEQVDGNKKRAKRSDLTNDFQHD